MSKDVISSVLAEINKSSNVASPRQNGVAGAHRKPQQSAPSKMSAPEGLGPMAKVQTSMGEVYALALRKGDRVRTKSGEFLPILAVNRIQLDREYLSYHPGALPIQIRAGAFGVRVPATDLLLAPGQKITRNQSVGVVAGTRAVEAVGRPQVCRAPEPMITYTQIHCAKPTSVCCEGLWVDTVS